MKKLYPPPTRGFSEICASGAGVLVAHLFQMFYLKQSFNCSEVWAWHVAYDRWPRKMIGI